MHGFSDDAFHLTAPMPMRVAVLDDYQGVALTAADWSPLKHMVDVQVFQDTLLNEDELAKRLASFEIVCAMRERTKFDASLLTRLPNLKLIATTGMRNAGIDINAASQQGIVVCGTGGYGNSTLEHIWALILGTVRYIAHEHITIQQSSPSWQNTIPMGLHGKTLGLVGLGRLGQATANIAKAFNMKVLAWSPHLTQDRANEAGVDFAPSKTDLFRLSDVVSIQLVLSSTTRHLITAEDFSLMKPSAFLINTSRGPIVEESALIGALQHKKIAGAGLDVFDIEPLPRDHVLRTLPNVTLSPHLGYVADDNYKIFWEHTVENIIAFMEGKPTRVIQ